MIIIFFDFFFVIVHYSYRLYFNNSSVLIFSLPSQADLLIDTGIFNRNTKELKNKMWWKNVKVKKIIFWQIIDEAPSISSISFNFS